MAIRNSLGVLAIILFLLEVEIFAQGICVPNTFEVKTVSGKVMAHLNKGDTPLSDISVKIVRKNNLNKAIKEVKTDEKGVFEFSDLDSGDYSLTASYPGLTDFYLDLSVSSQNTSFKDSEIIIWLNADFLKPCSGSYAELKQVQIETQVISTRVDKIFLDNKEIKKNYEIFFRLNEKWVKANRTEASFTIPEEVRNNEYQTISITFGKNKLDFSDLHKSKFSTDWVIGVEEETFSKEYANSEEAKKLERVYYIEFLGKNGITKVVVKEKRLNEGYSITTRNQ